MAHSSYLSLILLCTELMGLPQLSSWRISLTLFKVFDTPPHLLFSYLLMSLWSLTPARESSADLMVFLPT